MRGRVKADLTWAKTENALKEASSSVKEAFTKFEESGMSLMKMRPNWLGGAQHQQQQHHEPKEAGTWRQMTTIRRAPQPPAGPGAMHEQPADVIWSHPGQTAAPAPVPGLAPFAAAAPQIPATPSTPAATAPSATTDRPSVSEDDGAMRRHCAALERLVQEIGLSPQAARVALRHLDAWIVGEAGKAEMAAAEAAAHASGEVILHVGDRVRLEGLVRNKEANGKHGELAAYRADDSRWKVVLVDGQVYWVRPKLLRPLELKRLPLPDPEAQGDAAKPAGGESPHHSEAIALAAGWARLEARQAAWKEEQEARDLELLEREMLLHKHQEALEAQQETLEQRRASMALDQARSIAELERHTDTTPGAKSSGVTRQYFYLDGTPSKAQPVEASPDEDPVVGTSMADDDDEDEACDEMWDADWATLSTAKAAPQAPAKNLPQETAEPADDEGPGAAATSSSQPFGGTGESTSPSGSDGAGCTGQYCEPPPQAPASAREPVSVAEAAPAATGSAAPTEAAAAAAPSRPAAIRTPSATTSVESSPRNSLVSPPSMAPGERDQLQRRLEEKRRLADMHNGEDLAGNKRTEFTKGRMPGAHEGLAKKLEDRRRQLDELEERNPAVEGA